MAKLRGEREAFGRPGIEARWTHGDKEAVGTAYAASSRLWFTIWQGIVTEVYYPTVDRPQTRDLQYLVTDGTSFFHDEVRHLPHTIERLDPALAYVVESEDPDGCYRIRKEILSDPHLPCLLQHTRITAEGELLSRLRLYALCAPHLAGGGGGNNAYVVEAAGRQVLVAEKNGTWLALGATAPFARLSCGYVGASDGWTDLAHDFRMDWEFDSATNGNVALMGELDLAAAEEGQTLAGAAAASGSVRSREFTLGLALGDGLHSALTTLFQGLGIPFHVQRDRYLEQWSRPARRREPLEAFSSDGGNLYRTSCNLLLAHEDKTYQGALIASLSIPWGEVKGDEEGKGGYHLVWTRDLVNAAMGLLASGNRTTPLRALVYLATSQLPDGSFPQNFWIDGTPYWKGIQLDEVAFPILLAHRLRREGALERFDPYPMVMSGVAYLVRQGPATRQERWEEASGYSPSTLAAAIAAVICAASYARERGDESTAAFLEQYADFLEGYLETWTVTDHGSLLPDVPRHYVRINPVVPGDHLPDMGVGDALLAILNRPPGTRVEFPARDVVDAGFLELVRYGVRRPDDPLIRDSLRVVDAVLGVQTPLGRCWRRYNHDGYGQSSEGGPYVGHGQGRAWPLLTGERGHYELAAGGDAAAHVGAMERFASATGLLPEQVWDEADRPDAHLLLGRPTGAAMPLLWAHAEYVKLLRSLRDARVFDRVEEVAERYLGDRRHCHTVKVWSFNYPAAVVRRGDTLRTLAEAPFRLRWSCNGGETWRERECVATSLGLYYADVSVPEDQQTPIRFTFYWPETERWEPREFTVAMQDDDAPGSGGLHRNGTMM